MLYNFTQMSTVDVEGVMCW